MGPNIWTAYSVAGYSVARVIECNILLDVKYLDAVMELRGDNSLGAVVQV